MVKEDSFYPLVENYIKNKFNCFVVGVDKGIKLGRADIIGVRDIYGDLLSTFEVIAVEVKKRKEPFVKAAGQAYGYSVYAHKCYLAEEKKYNEGFSSQEIDIAGKLGIGLIEIKGKCREVLSSPHHHPVEPRMFELLKNLGYVKCTICGTLFEEKPTSRSIKKVEGGKAFYYFLEEFYDERRKKYDKHTKRSGEIFYDRRYVCYDCLNHLLLPLIEEYGAN